MRAELVELWKQKWRNLRLSQKIKEFTEREGRVCVCSDVNGEKAWQ